MLKSLEYDVEYTPQAREDIREIVLWYRNEREGLEDRFLLSLEASTNSIVSNPLGYQVNFESIRSLLLHRFPYRLYYFIQNKSISIVGVIHTKRTPRLIRKRIK